MADSRLGAEPSRPGAIVGRETEIDDLVAALAADGAIISVHGQSGIGKSRLLAEVATRMADRDGGDTVALLDCRDIASTGELADELERACQRTTVTIVLDHVDQTRHDLPELLSALVAGRGARCLVAAVRPLDRGTTRTVAIPPLAVPPTDDPPAAPTAAMQLFAARVADVAPEFELDNRTTTLLTVLVRRLGGVPLALELAAARHGLLGLNELVRMVQDADVGLGALGSSERGRHHSMVAALEWSLRHLDDDARQLLLTLSVFDSEVDAGAIARVHGGDLSEVLDALSALVDLRLVDPVGSSADLRRFRLPPMVAVVARGHLTPDQATALRARHAEHYANAIAAGAALMLDAREHELDPGLLLDLDEAHRAVVWLAEQDRVDEACRRAADLTLLLSPRAALARILPTLESLLGRAAEASDAAIARVRVAACASALAVASGPDETGRAIEWWKLGAEAITDAEPRWQLWSHLVRVRALPVTGDFAAAAASAAAGLDLAEQIGHPVWQARYEAWTGMVHHQLREFPRAVALGERALRRSLATGDRAAQIRVGLLLHLMPDSVRRKNPMLPSLETLLGHADDLGDLDMQRRLLEGLVIRAVHAGDTRDADVRIDRLLGQVQPPWGARDTVGALLMTLLWAALRERHGDVARLAGAIRPREDMTLGWTPPATVDRYHEALAAARRALGSQAFDEALSIGTQAGADANLRHAHNAVAAAVATARPAPGATGPEPALTPREQQVLSLLVEGLRNKEIAQELGSTAKSVMHQTSGIYRKLGVRGRAEAASVALREGLVPPT